MNGDRVVETVERIGARDPLMLGPTESDLVVVWRGTFCALDHPTLGRKGAGGALGEETAVIRAILAAGGTGWWVPDASIEHWIPRERQTVRYLRGYYALQGKTFHRWDGDGRRGFGGRPLWLWRKILRVELAYTRARLSGDPHRWLKPLVEVSILRGSTMR